MTDTDSDVAKVAKLTKDIRIGMMTTVGPDGHFVSRPMAQQEVEFDGDLWFFAERGSRKVAHIAADPHVGLTLTSNDTWISLDGEAQGTVEPVGGGLAAAGAGGPEHRADQVQRSHRRILGHPGWADRVGDQ